VLVAVALTRTATQQFIAPNVAIAFGLYIAFGELLRLVLPGGRQTSPIAMSAALSYAMVLKIAGPIHLVSGEPARQFFYRAPPLQVVVVAAAGMVIGSPPHIAAGRRPGLTGMSARLVAVACVAFIFTAVVPYLGDQHWLALGVLAAL